MSMKGMLLLQAAAVLGAVYNSPGDIFYHRKRVRRENKESRKRKDARAKEIAKKQLQNLQARQLHKFIIKGHEIEAYSRKDAIVELKHKGLL